MTEIEIVSFGIGVAVGGIVMLICVTIIWTYIRKRYEER